jgi:xanthine dehydrogenase YagR molybdenum-binding subunit
VAALLARRTGRPVRCVNDREAEQTDTGNRPSTTQRVTLGARRDGRLTAIVCDADVPLGVGGWEGGPAALFHEMYSCPNVRTVERFAWTNTPAMMAFRAPGHVEGAPSGSIGTRRARRAGGGAGAREWRHRSGARAVDRQPARS